MDQPLDTFRSTTSGWLRGSLAGWATLLLCLVGIGLLIVLVKWIENVSTTYELTQERLIIRRGIFSKSIDEIELYRVKDIRMTYSLIGGWAGIGTIALDHERRDHPRRARWSSATSPTPSGGGRRSATSSTRRDGGAASAKSTWCRRLL